MVDKENAVCYIVCIGENKMANYDAFQTIAVTQYHIPNEIMMVVRPWVENHWTVRDLTSFDNIESDLGYAELADITDFDSAMKNLHEMCWMWQVEGPKAYKKFISTAGGREGKGFYRYALKAYYLYKLWEQ
jgi:hypothetical protein